MSCLMPKICKRAQIQLKHIFLFLRRRLILKTYTFKRQDTNFKIIKKLPWKNEIRWFRRMK